MIALEPPRKIIPRVLRLGRQPRMTIALGLRCFDGLVLATDSLENDGISKRFVDKLWTYEVQGNWGIALAAAGEADLADSFTDDLREILGNSDFDEARLLLKVRASVRAVRKTYPDAEFGFLCMAYGKPTLYQKLFRVTDKSDHLGPVLRYQSLGIGSSVANYLLSNLYIDSMCVNEAAKLATFVLAQVKNQIDGCGGPTSIVSFGGLGDAIFEFRLWSCAEIAEMEAAFGEWDLQSALREWWRLHNPEPPFTPSSFEPGGKRRFVRTVHLNTKP